MESVEDRILLSAAVPNPLVAVAESSSPAAASLAAVSSYMISTLEQWLITLEQDMSNAVTMLSHDIAQAEAYFVKEVDQFLGIPTGSDATSSTTATNPQPSSGSQATGRGSGSGASLTGHGNNPTTGGSKIEPMTGSGSAIVYFSQSPINTVEPSCCGSVSATVNVSVRYNPNTSVSVDYSTQDGSATAGTDYKYTYGTLYFAPGQMTPDQINIPIYDDGGDETPPNGYDTFSVELSGAQNATIVQPNPVYVNIDEGPQQQPDDILQWNPCDGNNASTVTNWWDVSQGDGFQLQAGAKGVLPTSPIVFDGNGPHSKNAPITWDQPKTVANITIRDGFNAQQTLKGNLESTGTNGTALSVDGTSTLYQYYNSGVIFQIDANATITNMQLVGDPTGQFIISGGITQIAQSPGYTEKVGVNIIINSGATLSDQSHNTLLFTNDKLQIQVNGTMDVQYGPNATNTLIDNGGNADDLINVSGGTLVYTGIVGETDTFIMPIQVAEGGTFIVTSLADFNNGKLIVQGKKDGTEYSVQMFDAGSSVQLSNGTTLQCNNDYYQADGTLETTDNTTCTLVDGSAGGGKATVAGGTVWIDNPGSGTYGELDVKAATLNFGGDLNVSVLAYTPGVTQGNQDLLKVVGGTFSFNPQASTSLYVNVYKAPPANGDTWTIIDSGNNITSNTPTIDFASMTTNPQTNLNRGVSKQNPKLYLLSF